MEPRKSLYACIAEAQPETRHVCNEVRDAGLTARCFITYAKEEGPKDLDVNAASELIARVIAMSLINVLCAPYYVANVHPNISAVGKQAAALVDEALAREAGTIGFLEVCFPPEVAS